MEALLCHELICCGHEKLCRLDKFQQQLDLR